MDTNKSKDHLWLSHLLAYWYSDFLFLFEEGHHFAEFFAYGFYGLILGSFSHGQELFAAGLVFFDPLAGKFSGLDFRQDLFHFGSRLFVDDARTSRVVAVLRGIGDGITHVAQAAFLDQVYDQLQFVETLEVGDLGGVAGL